MAAPSAHEDKRYLYLRGLFKRASAANVANYREREWLHLCTVLAKLSLAEEPLTSRHAVMLCAPPPQRGAHTLRNARSGTVMPKATRNRDKNFADRAKSSL